MRVRRRGPFGDCVSELEVCHEALSIEACFSIRASIAIIGILDVRDAIL